MKLPDLSGAQIRQSVRTDLNIDAPCFIPSFNLPFVPADVAVPQRTMMPLQNSRMRCGSSDASARGKKGAIHVQKSGPVHAQQDFAEAFAAQFNSGIQLQAMSAKRRCGKQRQDERAGDAPAPSHKMQRAHELVERNGGYKKEFKRYSREQMVQALHNLGDVVRPRCMARPADCVCVRSEPNYELESNMPLELRAGPPLHLHQNRGSAYGWSSDDLLKLQLVGLVGPRAAVSNSCVESPS